METSSRGRSLIQKYEKCRLVAYQDIHGIWTIGWGHTGPDVSKDSKWSQAKADFAFTEDLRGKENCIHSHVTVPLTQGEFDALVSLVYNIGCHHFVESTLLDLLNDSDYNGASLQFVKWDHVNGTEVAGLKARRLEERELFEFWMVG